MVAWILACLVNWGEKGEFLIPTIIEPVIMFNHIDRHANVLPT